MIYEPSRETRDLLKILNPGLDIKQVDPKQEQLIQERNEMRDLSNARRGLLILVDGNAPFLFFARYSHLTDKLVGYSALKSHDHDSSYGISYLTHPDFGNQLIATSLLAYAIDFAYHAPEIERLYAIVIAGSLSEKVINRFVWDDMQEQSVSYSLHHVYYLDTKVAMPVRSTIRTIKNHENGMNQRI